MRGGGGGLPIWFHLVLPPPQSWVQAVWAVGEALSARQSRFARVPCMQPVHARPTATMPKRKVSSTNGEAKERPRGDQ